MAMAKHEEPNPSSSLLDALYCEEEQWEDAEEEEEEEDEDVQEDEIRERNSPSFLRPILLLEQDLFWEDEELLTLFSREKQGGIPKKGSFDVSLSSARKEAVEWILKVNAHFGFCTLTSVLAVNYFDRFISSFHFHNDKPWMFQLAAVTCLSLAAKVEETYVPLLLDLQVEGTKYVFEAKTIQKMELLVLSTLEWKMNPVTPLSFLDHIIRRLGLKNHLHWEFLRRCESLLLSVLTDWRLVSYVPSLLATATMMHVIDQIEACNPLDYQNQLLGVLNISKEKVKDCYRLIVEKSGSNPSGKRKHEEMINNGMDLIPNSPNGVVESCYYYDYLSSNSDSSSDSWITENSSSRKKGRTMSLHEQEQEKQQQQQPLPLQLPSLSRVFVNIIGSPR